MQSETMLKDDRHILKQKETNKFNLNNEFVFTAFLAISPRFRPEPARVGTSRHQLELIAGYLVPVGAGRDRSCAGLCRLQSIGAGLCRPLPVPTEIAEIARNALKRCSQKKIFFNFVTHFAIFNLKKCSYFFKLKIFFIKFNFFKSNKKF